MSAQNPSSPKTGRKPWVVLLVLCLWLATVGNIPLWQASIEKAGGFSFWMLGWAALIMAFCAVLLLLLAWPRVLRVWASVLLVAAAMGSYFMWQYTVVLDPTMLANAVGTDVREVRDLLSWRMLASLLLIAGLPMFWLWRQPIAWHGALGQLWRNVLSLLLAVLLAVGLLLLIYSSFSSFMRTHTELRYMINPLNSVYSLAYVAVDTLPKTQKPLQVVGEDARLGASHAQARRPLLLVLVVGETARAANFGLAGYARNTTPGLQRWREQEGLVYFSQVQSCGTNTAVSVPCMFSPLTRKDGGDDTPEHENLLDVLQRAGLAVLWIDNQSGCKGVCSRVEKADTRALTVPGLCADGECVDEVMLHELDARIAALPAERRARGVVLVMHQMGSHGPAYYKRTRGEHKVFLPECRQNTLSECEPQQLVNAYDNTIAATDRFLTRTLEWLKQRSDRGQADTGLLYASDHGESLGEGRIYLHGLPYAVAPKEQTHVPMLTWLSKPLQDRLALNMACLRDKSGEPYSHDHWFHTVLGLADVQTQAHEAALDIVQSCKKH